MYPSFSVRLLRDHTDNCLAVCREMCGSAFMGRTFRVPQPASVVSGSIGFAVLSGTALGQRIVVFPLLQSS